MPSRKDWPRPVAARQTASTSSCSVRPEVVGSPGRIAAQLLKAPDGACWYSNCTKWSAKRQGGKLIHWLGGACLLSDVSCRGWPAAISLPSSGLGGLSAPPSACSFAADRSLREHALDGRVIEDSLLGRPPLQSIYVPRASGFLEIEHLGFTDCAGSSPPTLVKELRRSRKSDGACCAEQMVSMTERTRLLIALQPRPGPQILCHTLGDEGRSGRLPIELGTYHAAQRRAARGGDPPGDETGTVSRTLARLIWSCFLHPAGIPAVSDSAICRPGRCCCRTPTPPAFSVDPAVLL